MKIKNWKKTKNLSHFYSMRFKENSQRKILLKYKNKYVDCGRFFVEDGLLPTVDAWKYVKKYQRCALIFIIENMM